MKTTAVGTVIISDTPQTFNFDNLPIRTVNRNGEVWFVAADVCAALDLSETHKAVNRLDDDEKDRNSIPTLGGEQEMTVVSESGLYSLVLGSRKPEAKIFKRWVTHEVLPAIRKTGGYGTQDQERMNLALSLSLEVAAKVSRTVFESVMAGNEDWKYDRWLFCMSHGRDNKLEQPYAKVIERNALVASLDGLAKMITEKNGIMPSNLELARLAHACNQRLEQRLVRK